MKPAATAAKAPAPAPPESWAAQLAHAQRQVRRATADKSAERTAAADRLRAALAVQGEAFRDACATACAAAVEAYNAAIGAERVRCLLSSRTGEIVLYADDPQAVLSLVWRITNAEAEVVDDPGLILSRRVAGRGRTEPLEFALTDADGLRVWTNAGAFDADALARFALEPWLRALMPAFTPTPPARS